MLKEIAILDRFIESFKPAIRLEDRFTAILSVTCGCGLPAKYEVFDDHQPHCEVCMQEAIDSDDPVLVRKIG